MRAAPIFWALPIEGGISFTLALVGTVPNLNADVDFVGDGEEVDSLDVEQDDRCISSWEVVGIVLSPCLFPVINKFKILLKQNEYFLISYQHFGMYAYGSMGMKFYHSNKILQKIQISSCA